MRYSIEEQSITQSNGYGEELRTVTSWVIYKDDGFLAQPVGWYPTLEQAQQELGRYTDG